ncbi:MAG TPA: hypothetical protein VFO27_17055, partial [Bryobacteraceae bacterium]|nr:hypothetical protein [Bryobacteraceae bacterium]
MKPVPYRARHTAIICSRPGAPWSAEMVHSPAATNNQAAADELRYRGLVSTGAVSASTYDQIKAAADAAKAQLAAAQAQ